MELNVNNLTIESGASINANTQGYAAVTGPGMGGNGGQAGGGGHGGMGGSGGGGSGGIAYGDLYAPITLGSGGGNQGYAGGAGGGAIKLVVSDTLTVNGKITTNGGNGATTNYASSGGGAGGSIWITSGSLTGNGKILANGGNGAWTYYGYSGGGAGGRIAIDVPVASNSFNGIVTAYGGISNQAGGAGTVYWAQTDKLTVNNNAQNGAATSLLTGNYDFNVLEIKSGGWVKVAGASSNITLANNSTILADGSGRLDVDGTIHLPANFVLSGFTLGILNGLDGASILTTQTNGGLELHANSPAHPNGVYVFENLTIKSGTFVRLISYDNPASTSDYGVTLQVGDLVVESGGSLESNGRGYAAATGPGKGGNGSSQPNRGGGGGHGGMGGNGGTSDTGGVTYGDLYAPITLGSGGGNQDSFAGGTGGGAIRLVVSNNLTVNGEITTNGGNGVTNNYSASGAGAGGSIWITSGSMTGNGKILSNGGNGAWTYYGYSGGGSGGRIAIYTNTLAPTIQLSVNGGTGHQNGGAGTIYLYGLDPSKSTLTVSPASAIANGTSTETIKVTVTLKNAEGIPVPNRSVEIALISGPVLSINNQDVAIDQYVTIGTTNTDGVIEAFVKTTVTGTRTLKARSGQELIIQQGVVTFLAGPLNDSNSTLTPASQQALADGTTPATITLTLLDTYGNPLSDAPVMMTASGDATLTQSSNITNAQGKVTAQVTDATPETITITVTANNELLTKTATIQFAGVEAPVAAVRFASSSAILQVQPGTTSAALQIEVRNEGLGSTGTLEITLPAHLNDWVEVTPSSIPSLASGESTMVTFTAHPLAAQPYGIYLGRVEITDGLGGKDNLMMTARVVPPQRTLVVTASDGQGVVSGARMWLQNNAVYTRVGVDGTLSTYQPSYTGAAGSDGKITFSNLDEGSYTYQLLAAYHQEINGSLTIIAGEGTQTADLALTALPGLYVEPGSLMLVAAAGEQANQTIRVTNTGAATLEDIQVELSGLPDWVQLVLPDAMTRLDSQEQTEFKVFANPPAGTASQWLIGGVLVSGSGTPQVSVNVSINVLAEADSRRDVRFVLTDQNTNPIPSGAQVIVKRVKPGQMTIDGQSIPYQPQFSQRVDANGSALFQGDQRLEVGEEYTYQAWGDNYQVSEGAFMVTPQDAPEGTQNQASAGMFMVSLQNTPEQAQDQPQVETVILQADDFVYTWSVTEIPGGINLEYHIDVTITYTNGTPAPRPDWCSIDCGWNPGTGTASWGGGSGPSLPPSVPQPRTRYSQMHLSQTVIVAWQAFHASLWLKNTSALPLDQMTVQVKIVDGEGVDRSADFVLQPPVAVEFGSIAPNAEGDSDWVIIPKGTGISTSTMFQVYAQIDYQLDGTAYSYNTLPQWIEVFPAPSLDIHYEIPDSEIACLEFDILAMITNNGAGPAVNLRYNSLQPTTDDNTTSFQLISATIDGEPQPDPMNLVLGALAPGASRVVAWRIRASKPVHLVMASADLLQSGGTGDPVPAISSVTVSMVPSVCLMAAILDESTYCPDGCGAASQSQNYEADPVNTRTGGLSYPVDDLSLLTSAGGLSFRRMYVSLATDKYLSPLGYGWTHNQDIRLIFSPPFINNHGGSNYVLFKDHSGNMYRFIDMSNGIYIAYPGVSASLVKNETTPNSYTIKDSTQNTYVFDESGLLQTKTDANGKAFNYSYAADGKLERVAAAGDNRYLQFAYNSAGNLVSVADHTGRSVSFTYDSAGNLHSSTDVLGKPWTYEYDSSHNLTRVLDPDGKTKVHNEYSTAAGEQGRVTKQFDGNGDLVIELIPQADGTVQVKDALDQTQVNTYNQAGTLTGDQDGAGNTTNKTYDPNFRPATITDASGNTTNLTWSDDGVRLTKIIDAALGETDIFYGPLNNPTSIIDPLDYETKYFYEDSNFPAQSTKVEYPLSFDGGVTYISNTYSYYAPNNSEGQPAGKLRLMTDALGQQTFYTYTSSGQVESVTTAYGTTYSQITSNLYDNYGNLIEQTDPAGIKIRYEYDLANRLTKVIQNYDPAYGSNAQDKYNLTTNYHYDVRGNQIAVQTPDDVITRTYFDLASRPVTIVQNLTGQDIEVPTPPTGGSGITEENIRTDTIYDDAGNAIVMRDSAGVVTRTYYDETNRPKLMIQNWVGSDLYGDISAAPIFTGIPDQNVRTEYYYDPTGNLIATKDTLGIINRTYYDGMNRPVTTIQNLTGQDIGVGTPPVRGSSSNIRTDTYYDLNGNVIAVVDPKGVKTRTYYDAINRPTN